MKRMLIERRTLLWVILFLGFTACIYAPFELYALNTEDLWFSLKQFWFIPLACGLTAILVAEAIGMLLKGKILRIYEGLLFGFGISVYIQGNFLNLKLGTMTGVEIDWSQYYGRLLINLMIWILLIGVAIFFSLQNKRQIRKVMAGISLFLTSVQLVTLVILLAPCIGENKSSECGYPTDKNLTTLSKENNILIFVLDKYDNDFFKVALEEVPELEEELDGFTWFTNYAGGYANTRFAIPFMLSGNYCLQGNPYAWRDSSCEEVVYWDELLKNGYEMSVYAETEMVPARVEKNSINYEKTDFKVANHKMFTVVLYRFVMCKYFPDIVKPFVWLNGYEFSDRRKLDSEYNDWSPRNLALVDYLNKEGVNSEAERAQFKFIHISGVHEPFDIDEYGNRIEGQSDELSCIKGSIRLVQRYMREIEELGIYDNSAIIITADHGTWSSQPTNPVFLVKPFNARGRLQTNNAPVSQIDLGPTILDLAGLKEESKHYGISVFDVKDGDERERYYYKNVEMSKDLKGNTQEKLIEYQADSEGIEPENFHLTGVEYDTNGQRISGEKGE